MHPSFFKNRLRRTCLCLRNQGDRYPLRLLLHTIIIIYYYHNILLLSRGSRSPLRAARHLQGPGSTMLKAQLSQKPRDLARKNATQNGVRRVRSSWGPLEGVINYCCVKYIFGYCTLVMMLLLFSLKQEIRRVICEVY